MRARWASAALALIPVAVAGCGATHRVPGGSGVVRPDGRVGPLVIDRSTPADVRRFAGAPAFDGLGTFEIGVGYYRALGYECSPRADGVNPGAYRRTGTRCRTIYFINRRTGKLAAFWTDSKRFRSSAGTTLGMSATKAAHLEHRAVVVGGFDGIERGTHRATLRIEAPCSGLRAGRCVVGHVTAFALESSVHGVGLLFI
jgi:hypothetical protein